MKITKAPKRLAEANDAVKTLLLQISAATDDELPPILDGISEWCWPRGDLHYWTATLNRFDDILAETCADYDLSHLQINDFTPNRKRLLVSVLRFSRLLLENCTNRKLYNSFEHLNVLLATPDVDVLEATLRLILRPAQQYSSQGGGRRAEFAISPERLNALAVTWAPREHGPTASASAASGLSFVPAPVFPTTPTPAGRPRGQSPPAPSARSQPSQEAPRDSQNEGLVAVDLGNLMHTARRLVDVLADAVEKYSIPSEDHFELLQKVRLAMGVKDAALRRQLLVCRLLAVAIYAHTTPESTASTQLFLYEPDIVQRLARVVDPSSRVGTVIQSGAFYALDALGRYRGKVNDVLTAVNASANHGILLHVLRDLVGILSTGDEAQPDDRLIDALFGFVSFVTDLVGILSTGDEAQPDDRLIDALFGFVSFVTSTVVGSNMVVSAGLLPLLIKLVEKTSTRAYMLQRTVTRAVGLIDSVLYAYQPSFGLFCAARGLDVFVARIESEVEEDVEDYAEGKPPQDKSTGADHPDNLYGHFLKQDGLSRLLALYRLPCLPYDFVNSVANDSLVTLIRFIVEISPHTVLNAALEHVKSCLLEAHEAGLLQATSRDARTSSALLELAKPSDEESAKAANLKFRLLVNLNAATHLLADIAPTFGYSGSKLPTTLFTTLNSASSLLATKPVSIEQLGDLQRVAAWENVQLKAATASVTSADIATASSSSQSKAPSDPTPSPRAEDTANDNAMVIGNSDQSSTTARLPTSVLPKKSSSDCDPYHSNVVALRHLSSSLPSSIVSFFLETSRSGQLLVLARL
ncbi:E3 ubiquitin-protein ligase/Putative upstream regulatory element binding protein [Ceraceosorus bombacis]|uniref:E3 ubiquitin-protein ligase/Putative upstream regulatory element binding protein n=1 Tax=Ceraceosorus bombacis TaxID=401625 RepID=A0A0P1BFW2_9BASI|nr:E3 ubiquitin-protein ligase/Putative upstream regulatory element binding protein [Ceraceosorus bombacis]